MNGHIILPKISFCHPGNDSMASYRYRCATPAGELVAFINDPTADVLIFGKPDPQDIPYASTAKREGRVVIVDICDMHFEKPAYRFLMDMADALTCPTRWMAQFIRDEFGREACVVPDPYEFPELLPHCSGDRLLWFGHALNIDSLQRVWRSLDGHPLIIVSNIEGCVPWSRENMLAQFIANDIVLMPETAPYKSANRTIEAIRQGCFVVAEPHPAINDIPGIWIGNIREGIEWAQQNQSEANKRMETAQAHVRESYSPATQAAAWRTAIQKALSSSTSDAETLCGPAGSTLIHMREAGANALAPT